MGVVIPKTETHETPISRNPVVKRTFTTVSRPTHTVVSETDTEKRETLDDKRKRFAEADLDLQLEELIAILVSYGYSEATAKIQAKQKWKQIERNKILKKHRLDYHPDKSTCKHSEEFIFGN